MAASKSVRWKPNVTVAAVIERDGRFLLVEEQAGDGLKLNTPAGHLDPGESPAEGCVRETLEETAHHFTPTSLIGIYMARARPQAERGEDVTYMRFAFAGTLGALEEGRALDEGIVRTVWMTLAEIRASVARHRSPLLLQCIEDYLAGQRHPLELVHVDVSVRSEPQPAVRR
ncbi:NUDIX hydrolase [Variovorax sp. KBW07]|uniref:NUDIX hydrolase n=1 Tax=Variovorax sp. KBW07 TaxID=2153358 RepID=UPI000F57A922|nr:NUDIX hydrolase [Variovorax sp. KBW07]RQO59456.1 NUDIX hydrolase [Variovorax sp. KBW07]